MVDKERQKRYKEKIDYAKERTDDVKTLISGLDDKIKRLACYKAFQEVVEVIFDIIAMLLKDRNKPIEDDYANIARLEEFKLITKNDAIILRNANGLRNRVVHRYNKTDETIAKKSIQELIPKLEIILEEFSKLKHGK